MLELEMGIEPEEGVTLLLLDDLSAIKLAKNPMFRKRSKHIAIKYNFIREKVENKEFVIVRRVRHQHPRLNFIWLWHALNGHLAVDCSEAMVDLDHAFSIPHFEGEEMRACLSLHLHANQRIICP